MVSRKSDHRTEIVTSSLQRSENEETKERNYFTNRIPKSIPEMSWGWVQVQSIIVIIKLKNYKKTVKINQLTESVGPVWEVNREEKRYTQWIR